MQGAWRTTGCHGNCRGFDEERGFHHRSLSERKIKNPGTFGETEANRFSYCRGAAENNLKNIDVKIPLGIMTCITGVSGSGKSSLINEILYKRLARDLNRARVIPGKHKDILGTDQLDKVINIDQSPIGRTPRSNPATYTGVFDQIRDLLQQQQMPRQKDIRKDDSVLM